MSNKIPSTVLELAKHAATERVPHPTPIAWAEYPTEWVIVFEDGRKLTFVKRTGLPAQASSHPAEAVDSAPTTVPPADAKDVSAVKSKKEK